MGGWGSTGNHNCQDGLDQA